MPYTPAPRLLTVTRPHPDDVGDDPYGQVSSVAYHHSFTRPKRRVKKSQQAQDGERLDAARERGRAESSAQIDAARDAFLATSPKKPSKKPGKAPVKKRGPNRNTKARWAAEDQAAGVNNYEELSAALLEDPLPLLAYELDDLAAEITNALGGEK